MAAVVAALRVGRFALSSGNACAPRLLRLVPNPDSCIAANKSLFNHLVGAGEQRRRHVEAERLRHDQVNGEVELGRLLDRKIGGLRPPNLADQVAGAPLKSMKATVPTGVENSYFS